MKSTSPMRRMRFENGCVANATASRVSMKTERKLRVFEDEAYLSIDLQQKILTVIRKRPGTPAPGELPVIIEERSFDQGDALKEEIDSFLACVRERQGAARERRGGFEGSGDRDARSTSRSGRPWPPVRHEACLIFLEHRSRYRPWTHKSSFRISRALSSSST